MSNKVLVTYASRSGSTEGVAEAIGNTLVENGEQVEVRPMNGAQDLTPYRAVVAGSAIRGGKWLPDAMRFMQTHREELAKMPFAAFLVCMTLTVSNEELRQSVADDMKAVRALVKPVSEGYFAGALEVSKLQSMRDRLILRAIVASGVWAEGDHRDWDAIRAWAANIQSLLQ